MTINDFAGDKQPLAGAAVYVWHCDRAGQYSLYSQAVTGENYLRGVQETDAKGQVTFTSIFPACYSGPLAAHPLRGLPQPGQGDQQQQQDRHVADGADRGGEQGGLRDGRLRAERANLGQVTLESDNVFGDGYDLQIPE